MGQLVAQPSLTDRMIRAARLDVALYNEVEADTTANNQALTVVVLGAVASGIGSALSSIVAGRPSVAFGGLIAGVVLALIGWAVWSYVMYFVGTRLFHGTATYGELLRTLGFAYTPSVLLILGFIPLLGGIIDLVVFIWLIVAGFIAIREALDLDTGNTIATIVVGFIAYAIVAAIVVAVFGALGVGALMLTGGAR
jgi:hypothetical protein